MAESRLNPNPSFRETDKVETLLFSLVEVEVAAEADESLMEVFFANDTLTEEEMRTGLKKGLAERGVFPVLCTSAKNVQGTKRLCDFVINYAPSPDHFSHQLTNGTEVKVGDTKENIASCLKPLMNNIWVIYPSLK